MISINKLFQLFQLFRYAILLGMLMPCVSAEEKSVSIKVLDTAGKLVEKREVRDSMMGVRNTLIFYTFKGQQSVLLVSIDNKTKTFPITATVYNFSADVTAEGLKKWLNNQHSDGLFPDVPKPVATYKIPAASCSIKSHQLIDRSKHRNGEYDNYTVKFHISEVTEKGVFKLIAFTGETKVLLKVK